MLISRISSGAERLMPRAIVPLVLSIGLSADGDSHDPARRAATAHFVMADDGSFGLRSSITAAAGAGRFETQAVLRGAASLLAPPRVTARPESRLVTRGDLVEEVRDTENGVEQSWSFERKPRGSGDLTVRIQVAGLAEREVDERGILFDEPTSGLRVRYGMGTWVDARGERIAVASRWEAGAITLTVPESVLERAAYPAVLDPSISAELSAGPVLPGPVQLFQRRVRAASDGTNFFVVWEDPRHLVEFARVTPAGAVLDPVGVPINLDEARYLSSYPTLAFDGTNFLVVWNGSDGIRARRLSKTGTFVDAKEINVWTGSGYPRREVAFDGAAHLVVWQTTAGIVGARVSTAGVLLDATPLLLANAPQAGSPPINLPRGVACDGTNCLVIWQDTTAKKLFGVRVSKALAPVDATPITIATGVTDGNPTGSVPDTARLLYDGSDYVVAYTVQAGTPTPTSRVRLTKVSPAGAVSTLSTDYAGVAAGLAFDGTAYEVLTGSAVTRVATDGTIVVAPTAIPVAITQWPAGLACKPSGCLFAWPDSRGDTVVYASRLSTANVWLDPGGFRVVDQADEQRVGGSAGRGTQGLVVWWQQQGTASKVQDTGAIFGARTTSAGAVSDPSGFRVSSILTPMDSTTGTPVPGGYYLPRVASNGTDYFVAWHQPSTAEPRKVELYGMRVSAAGGLLDPTPMKLIQGAQQSPRYPDVIFDGTNYLVTWFPAGAVRVSPAGALLDATPIVPPIYFSALGWNGTNYLAVFTTGGTNGSTYDIKGIRLDTSLQPIDPLPFTISNANEYQDQPAVASDGTDFLVVWMDRRNAIAGAYSSDIYGSRVTAAGAVLDPNGIPIEVNTIGKQVANEAPAVAFSPGAGRYFVVWSAAPTGAKDAASAELRGAEIETTGTVRAPGSFSVAPTPYLAVDPTLSPLDGSKVLLSYSRFDPAPPFGSRRTRTRIIDLNGTSGADAGTDGGLSAPDGGVSGPDGGASDSGAPASDAGTDDGGPSGDDHGEGGGGDDGQCGCRLVDGHPNTRAGFVAALFAAGLLLRRRQRRREGRA